MAANPRKHALLFANVFGCLKFETKEKATGLTDDGRLRVTMNPWLEHLVTDLDAAALILPEVNKIWAEAERRPVHMFTRPEFASRFQKVDFTEIRRYYLAQIAEPNTEPVKAQLSSSPVTSAPAFFLLLSVSSSSTSSSSSSSPLAPSSHCASSTDPTD